MTEQIQKRKILVADDEPEVIRLVRMMLELEGYMIVAAADGQAALIKARSEQPDLILLDVRMPKMSGLTVLEKLGEDPSTSMIPVIMLSVVTTYPDVQKALRRGAIAYLPKPFDMQKMVQLVARVRRMDADEREAYRRQMLKDTDVQIKSASK